VIDPWRKNMALEDAAIIRRRQDPGTRLNR
jgi:hypothetical protein